ncbi:MAG: Lrp/AsnC family transcriptional regulator [Gammaproteobacteria bacterium]|nr:Lrp/AsnC family transcriptional regulator [Gammaproteobacteria bacterium]
MSEATVYRPDEKDLLIIEATQGGLPVSPTPYHDIAEALDMDPEDVMQRVRTMQEHGVIRRIGIVPNHYKLGYTANGMSVWDVDDRHIRELGRKIGRLDFVSHCYHRPRHLPEWPYNLFAMVHGRNRDEVFSKVKTIADMLGDARREYQVLFSTEILKKTGLRLS